MKAITHTRSIVSSTTLFTGMVAVILLSTIFILLMGIINPPVDTTPDLFDNLTLISPTPEPQDANLLTTESLTIACLICCGVSLCTQIIALIYTIKNRKTKTLEIHWAEEPLHMLGLFIVMIGGTITNHLANHYAVITNSALDIVHIIESATHISSVLLILAFVIFSTRLIISTTIEKKEGENAEAT